jgi:hypothetical protein
VPTPLPITGGCVPPYYSINPALFDSPTHWCALTGVVRARMSCVGARSRACGARACRERVAVVSDPELPRVCRRRSYRDLQRLCKRLDLPAAGKRAEVAARLQQWHRESRRLDQAGKFLGVEVRASPGGKAINPQLVSPLRPVRQASFPSPSILSSGRRAAGQPPLRGPEPRLCFSPFNQVKLIPAKEQSEMYGRYREPPAWEDGEESDADSDMSECDNEVLRESIRRANQ